MFYTNIFRFPWIHDVIRLQSPVTVNLSFMLTSSNAPSALLSMRLLGIHVLGTATDNREYVVGIIKKKFMWICVSRVHLYSESWHSRHFYIFISHFYFVSTMSKSTNSTNGSKPTNPAINDAQLRQVQIGSPPMMPGQHNCINLSFHSILHIIYDIPRCSFFVCSQWEEDINSKRL